jgi:hypothetical protein
MGGGNPVLLVDNRLSTKAIHVGRISIGVVATLEQSVTFFVRGGLTFGSTFGNRNLLTPSPMLAGSTADLEGTVFSEWAGTGAMAGISGVTGVGAALHAAGLISLAQYQGDIGRGIVIPAGGSLGIFGAGTAPGNGMMAGIEGFHG